MNTPIPSLSDVKDASNFKHFRIAEGKLRTGREADGTLEEYPGIVGKIKRVGVFHGTLDDGTSYSKLECELETEDHGTVSVGANLKSQTASTTFAEALVRTGKDEVIFIKPNQSTKQNRYGSYTTYTNVSKVDPETFKATPIKIDRPQDIEDYDDYREGLLKALEDHPHWGERPQRATDEPTELENLGADVAAKGWPRPDQAPDVWLDLINKGEKASYKSLDDIPNDVLAEVRKKIADKQKMPKALEAVAGDEFDPFEE